MGFAEMLSEMMKEKGVTQSKLAKNIGYSQRAVSKWINKQAEPTETPIVLCAKFFNVTTDEILGYTDGAIEQAGDVYPVSLSRVLPDELKFQKNYLALTERGKARVLAYCEFVLEEEGKSKH
jgi:transcriptional regulator with XRE-family HTH domain